MSSIDDPSVKAIDDKSKNNSKTDTERTTNDWGGFFKSVFQNLLTILIITLLVSCSIFYARSDKSSLDKYFPTELESYITKPRMSGGNGKCNRGSFSFSGPNISRPSVNILDEAGLNGNVYGWPYSMYDKTSEGEGTFKNWFALVVAKTYMFSRECWKKIYGFPIIRDFPDWSFLFIAPFQSLLGMLVAGIGSVIISIISGFREEWWWGVVYMCCILPICLICYTVPFLQSFLFLFLIVGAPLLINKKVVASIAHCNKNLFGFLFGALVVGSAFQFLVPSVGYSALGLLIILLIKTLAF